MALGPFLRQILVAHGVMGHGEFQNPVKQQPGATGTSAVEAEHELVEVAGQVRHVHRSLVCFEQPAFCLERDSMSHSPGRRMLSHPQRRMVDEWLLAVTD
ncbi:hypothetical protein CI15_33090 [Paraburkholderia monticola]|uniref:Uncharacterized protein n=1 Tax=Paraburkholderia monticola TaxID=1399968 RepID=A0A149PBI4_9BURK|nr:hypothetical protein CI15_33090 [Paraburkholderia monticola]